MKIKYINLALPVFFIVIFSPLQANAYLDPGTGSIVIQVVIAFVAGLIFSIKTYWHKIKSFLERIILRKKLNDGHDNETNEEK